MLVANKSDLFDQEKVKEEEAKEYAKNNGMIFHVTSAYNGIGVEELFKHIGNKLIKPNGKENEKEQNEEKLVKNETINLNKNKDNEGQKKKHCCNYIK